MFKNNFLITFFFEKKKNFSMCVRVLLVFLRIYIWKMTWEIRHWYHHISGGTTTGSEILSIILMASVEKYINCDEGNEKEEEEENKYRILNNQLEIEQKFWYDDKQLAIFHLFYLRYPNRNEIFPLWKI